MKPMNEDVIREECTRLVLIAYAHALEARLIRLAQRASAGFPWSATAALLPLVLALGGSRPAAQAPAGAHALLDDRGSIVLRGATGRRVSVRVEEILGADADPAFAPELLVALPEGGFVTALPERAERAFGGGRVARYRLREDPAGEALFSVAGDAATGTVRYRRQLYQLRGEPGGEHAFVAVHEDFDCATTYHQHAPGQVAPDGGQAGAEGPALGSTAGATLPTVDVLVPYTQEALLDVGNGVNGMLSLINLAVYETNEGYAASDVYGRVNLVGTTQVDYAEDGDLRKLVDRMQDPADGYLDEVPVLRWLLGADIVNLICDYGNSASGLAFGISCPTTIPTFADKAYCVTTNEAAVGNLSFGHEMGHLMGCHHDTYHAGSPSCYFTGAFGYATSSGFWESIMSKTSASRVNAYSNPDKNAPDGLPLGVVGVADNSNNLQLTMAFADSWGVERNVGNQVVTGFGGTLASAGVMFDVDVYSDLSLEAISINTSATAGTSVSIEVWYYEGDYGYVSRNQLEWTPLGGGTATSSGPGAATYVPLDSPIPVTLERGKEYALCVLLTNWDEGSVELLSSYQPTSFRYPGNHLTIQTPGLGKSKPRIDSESSDNHVFNGILHYRGGDGEHALETTYSPTHHAHGAMFTATLYQPTKIRSLDIDVDAEEIVTVDVWYRPDGSHYGYENDPSEWVYLGSDFKTLGQGSGAATRVFLTPPSADEYEAKESLELDPGEYGFYVNVVAGNPLLDVQWGENNWVNEHLRIDTGTIFTSAGVFTGSTIEDMSFCGAIRYSIDGPYLSVPEVAIGRPVDVSVDGALGAGTAVVGMSLGNPWPSETPFGWMYLSGPTLYGVFSIDSTGSGSTTLEPKFQLAQLIGAEMWLHCIVMPNDYPSEVTNLVGRPVVVRPVWSSSGPQPIE